MARYTAKLVDRTGWSDADKHGIQLHVQRKFDEAFEGTADSVDVSWGAGTPEDNLVIHFVPDIPHSYLKQKFPDAVINPMDGGYTNTSQKPLSGTEIYQTVQGNRNWPWETRSMIVFHESLHNLFPFQPARFVHDLDGGGEAAGYAAAIPKLAYGMTQHNKELMRQGFSVKNPQLL
jgi:hypothetical protein